MTVELPLTEIERRDALAGRLFESALGAFDLLTIHLGLDLGLYDTLRGGGPASAAELAERAGIDERYAREWLEQQAVTGILEVDDATADAHARRYSLPPGHTEALLDKDSPAASQSMLRFVVSAAPVLPALAEAYRRGEGIPGDAYPGAMNAQELANRPIFRSVLCQEWIPAIPDIHTRLGRGGRVADLACGAGWLAIALAQAYPAITVDGLDIDSESIERARGNAAAEGLGEDRLRFHVVDAVKPELDGRFDLVTIFEAAHDLPRPVEVLESARRLLAPGGTVLVVDENVQEVFTAPGDEIERTMYAYSVLFCLPESRVDPASVATGTVMRPATLARYAEEAGFTRVTVLPIAHEVFRLYRLDP